MKTLILVLAYLTIFTFAYSAFLDNINYGVMNYDEWVSKTCEIKQLENGYTQLDSCDIYKIKDEIRDNWDELLDGVSYEKAEPVTIITLARYQRDLERGLI